MLRWALLLLAGCDGVFGIEHIAILDAPDAAPPDAVNGYATTVLTDHPRAYLPLDETKGPIAHDRVGGHDGMYLGTGITYGADPPFPSAGHAIAIDGLDGAVDLGDQFGFAGTQPYSIEAWVSPRLDTHPFYSIVSKWRSPGELPAAGWDVFFDDAMDIAYTRESATHTQARANVKFTPGWHYVVATYDGMTMKLYYDEVAASTVPTAFDLDTITQSLEIGGGNGDPAAVPLYGSIGQVAIYDYALSATQISAHYDARSL